jgi:hypothetical protein
MPRALKSLKPEHFAAAIEAAAAAYPRKNSAGVLGACIQRKRVGGRRRKAWTLGVFVRRKELEPPQAVRAITFCSGGQWYELLPDVVATGQPGIAAAGGGAPFSGLHAGASIRVAARRSCAGGVACLLTTGNQPTHLLTAGHLFPSRATRTPILAALSPKLPPRRVGVLQHNLLDTQAGIDVALVTLTPGGAEMARVSGLAERLPRLGPEPFEVSFIDSTSLRVFLPTRGDYHAGLDGERRFNRFTLHSGYRPAHEVRDVITTGFAHNTPGNSGTVLMTDDEGGLAQGVGVAVGFAGDLSLHEPLDRALESLRVHTRQRFKIWSQAL